MKRIAMSMMMIIMTLTGFSLDLEGTYGTACTLFEKNIEVEWTFHPDGIVEFAWWDITGSSRTKFTGTKGAGIMENTILTVTITEVYNPDTATWNVIPGVVITYKYTIVNPGTPEERLELIQDLDMNGAYVTGNIFGSATYDQYLDPTYVLGLVR